MKIEYDEPKFYRIEQFNLEDFKVIWDDGGEMRLSDCFRLLRQLIELHGIEGVK